MTKRTILSGLLLAGAALLQPASAAEERPAAAPRAVPVKSLRPVQFGKRTETIGTFHGWSIWFGWNGSFSDSYVPYSETYSWNTVLAPEGVYVALTSAGANYSGVDVNAGMGNFFGAMVSPDGPDLTWTHFSSLMGVSVQYGLSSNPFAFGPLSGMGAAFQTGPTFFRGADGKLIHAIQYSSGFSVSHSLLPINLPVQVSIDVDSNITGKDTGFYPVIAWDVGEGTSGENPLDHVILELQRIAGTSGDGYHDAMSAQFARIVLTFLERIRGGAGSVPDDPDPAQPAPVGTCFAQFLANDSVAVPSGGPGGSIDAMIRAAQQWLDSGDTGNLSQVLAQWRAVDLPKIPAATASIRAATDVAFEMGYRHGYAASGRTDTIYSDDVVEVQASFGQPCKVTVTAAEVLSLLKGRASVSAGDLEGLTVVFDNPPETYLSSQATETGVAMAHGKAAFEFVQGTHAPFVMGIRVATGAATGGFALELARRVIQEDGVQVVIAPGALYAGRAAKLDVTARRISGGKMPAFTVTLAGAGIDATAPGAKGRARFKRLTPSDSGSVLVTVTAEGLPEVVRSVPVHDTWDVRSATKRIRLSTLKPGVGKSVSVTVRDLVSRAPFAGGEVRLAGCGVDVAATVDAKGVARFAGVEPASAGTIVVTATRDGHVLDRRPVIAVQE